MWFNDLLKIKYDKLPQYTNKEDLPKAQKKFKERFGWFSGGGFERDKSLTEKDKNYYRNVLAKAEGKKNSKLDWIEKDDKMVKAMERAYARKDKKSLGGWLKAWAKEDRRDLRRFEKDLMRD